MSTSGRESDAAAVAPILPIRKVVWFLLRFALCYGLLLAPWPGLTEGFGKVFASAADRVFGSDDPTHRVRIRWMDPDQPMIGPEWAQDTVLVLEFRGGPRNARPSIFSLVRSSRYTGYVPAALLLALVLATPVPWSRRLWAILWGLPLVTVFVGAMLLLVIQGWFHQEETRLLMTLQPHVPSAWDRFVQSFWQISNWMMPYYVVPTLIWILVTLRPGDLDPILAADARED